MGNSVEAQRRSSKGPAALRIEPVEVQYRPSTGPEDATERVE